MKNLFPFSNRLLIATLLCFTIPNIGTTQTFVDATASGTNDGSSWTNAYTDLQTALTNTTNGEIWVANGTYKPVTCNPCLDANRQIFFNIPPDVQLYGGFSGSETSLNQRDWTTNLSILSGDIGTAIDSTDNSYKIIVAENALETTVLDGFIIEEGNADGSFGFSSGGGLYLDANPGGTAHIQVRNCTFRNNYGGGGGAIAIDCVLGGQSEAIIRNCIFEGNTASLQVTSTGAAIFMQGNSSASVQPKIINCTFQNNFSGNDGGAISATPTGAGTLLAFEVDSCLFINNKSTDRGAAIWYRMSSSGTSRVMIRNSQFISNQAGGNGGAIFARSSFDNISNDTIINCLFSQNTSDGSSSVNDGEGGAIYLRGSQSGTRNHVIANCVFDRNFATDKAGAVYTTSNVFSEGTLNANFINCSFYGNSTLGEGGAVYTDGSLGTNTTNFINSIFWKDSTAFSANEFFNNNAAVTASYCNIDGGIPVGIIDGGNNLDTIPQYADPENGDLRITGCSPLINAGQNSAVPPAADPDIDGHPRIHEGTVDLGAYEVGIIYVDLTATTGANTGKSWDDAFTDFQDALAVALAGNQIWVAKGTYFPTTCTLCTMDDRDIAFHLVNNVEVYGGFDGSETQLSQRDWINNTTILSGDIGTPVDSTDNSFRVIIAENVSAKTIIDGFTIEEGNADGSFGFSSGGGLYLDANPGGIAHLQIRNCTIRDNYGGGGGGIAIDCVLGGQCEAVIRNCVFDGNTASLQITSTGAAIFMQGNSSALVKPKIINCTFQNNFSGNDGGAISATPTGAGSILAFEVDSCLFINNRSFDRGAAIWYRMSSSGESAVVIRNSQFISNLAGGNGGAIFARSSFDNISNDSIINCYFSLNSSDGSSTVNDGEGGAIYLRGSQNGTRNHQIINCIFDRNSAIDKGGAVVTTSNIFSEGTCNADFVNCTFYGNSTNGEGGAVYTDGSLGINNTNFTNCIFWEDTAMLSGNEFINNGATTTVSYCDIDGGIPAGINDGGNNIDANPQFLDVNNEDFRISSCSPCIDAGLNTAMPIDLVDMDGDGNITEQIDIDLLGNNRFFNNTVDIGAYEYNGDPPLLTAQITINPVSCNGFCDGEASVTVNGGVPGYSYTWSNGSTDVSVIDLCAGTHYVTIFDSFGCIKVDSFVILENEALIVSTNSDTTFCSGDTASLTAMASGGDGQFTYDWDNGLGNGDTHTVSPALTTTYNVTVTDGNGCIATESVTVLVNELPLPVIDGIPNFCPGDTTLLETGNYVNYLWTTNETTQSISVNAVDTYGVTVTDNNGCTGEAEIIVSEFSAPSPIISGSSTFCSGSATTLDAGNDFTQYLWSDGSDLQTLEVTTEGTYSVTVTDQNGCTGTAQIEVTENQALQPNITGELTFCQGDSTTINAGNFDSYLWSNNDTTQFTIINSPGEYTVTVSDGTGCTGEATVEITTLENPQPVISGSSTFCTGSATTLDAGNDFTQYLWSDGSDLQTLEVTTEGTFSVTVTDQNGCTGTAQIEVTENQALQPNITGELTFCQGDSTTINSGNFDSYLWSNNDTTQFIVISSPGEYTVTVSDGTGCTGETTVEITALDNPQPVISGSSTFCTGSSTTLDAGNDFTQYLWSDGSDLQTLEVTTEGTFSVTVTDQNGCTGIAQIEVTENQALQPNITGELTFCQGDSTTINAGNFDTYFWSNNDTTQFINISSPGEYTVTVSDGTGCTGEATVELTALDNPQPVISGSSTFCTGSATTLDAGNDFTQYLWSDGSDLQTLEVTTEGTFSVTVTDLNGCTGTAQIEVTENQALQPNIIGELTFCQGDSTTINAGNFDSYLWSNNDTTQFIVISSPGEYTVTVSDGTGCTGETTVEITALDNPQPVISGSSTFCTGSATTLDAGNDFTQYLWSDGSDLQTLEVTTEGTFSVTVTDLNGCTGTAQIDVTENQALQPNITGELTFCQGDSTTINAGNFDSYLWSNNDTTQFINISSPGEYTVTVSDGTGCTGEATVEITTLDNPQPVISGSSTFCTGSATTLDAGNDFTQYLWSDGSELQTLEVTTEGTFSVTVTDQNGCTGTAQIEVTENQALQPNIIGELTFCQGDSTTINAGNFDSYLWSNNDTTQFINISSPGNFTVTVSDGTGCTGEATVEITTLDNPQPVISGSSTFCTGSATTLDAGNDFAQYLWSDGSALQTLIVNMEDTFSVTVTDLNGCTGTAQIEVTESQELQPNITGDLSFCLGDSTFIDAGLFDTYLWSNNDTTQVILVHSPGNYSVTVSNTDGCTGEASVQVSIKDTVITNENILLCYGDEYNGTVYTNDQIIESVVTGSNGCDSTHITFIEVFTALTIVYTTDELCTSNGGGISVFPQGGLPDYTYLWDIGDTTAFLFDLPQGTYTVTVTDDFGCTASESITIDPLEGITLTYQVDEVACFGDTNGQIDVTVNGGTAPFFFDWSNGATTEDIDNLAPGDYNVLVTDANDCLLLSSFIINEPDELLVDITATNPTNGNNGTASASVTGGTTPYSYQWNNGANSATIDGLSDNNIYIVTVTDANGCIAIESVQFGTPSSTQDLDNLLSFEVFPNPSDGLFSVALTLKQSESIALSLYTVYGQKVWSFNQEYGNRLLTDFDGRELAPGTFFLVAVVEDRAFVRKVVVVK